MVIIIYMFDYFKRIRLRYKNLGLDMLCYFDCVWYMFFVVMVLIRMFFKNDFLILNIVNIILFLFL